MHSFKLGDTLKLRKKHPCGSDEWEVIRYGADVKIKCVGCGRIVMIDRPTLQKESKKFIKYTK